MLIKRCNINELDKLVPLFDRYRQHFKQSSEPAAVSQYLSARLESEEAIVYVAENEKAEFDGFALLYPSFSSIGLAPIWILNDFYLSGGNNKRQLARQLLDQITSDCKTDGGIRVEVNTRKENHKLYKLYKDYGFEKDYKYDYYFLQLDKNLASEMLK